MKEEKIKYISIYAASSPLIDAAYYKAASETGRLLAAKGYGIINGAGNTGLMQAVSDAALENEGKVIGIIPEFMVARNWHHPHLTQLIQVPGMHQRKQLMADKSEGVIALPGGCGTLEEILEIITWKQLGLYDKTIIILNTNHFYDPLLLQLQKALDEQFMDSTQAQLWHVASTPEEAVQLITLQPACKFTNYNLTTT